MTIDRIGDLIERDHALDLRRARLRQLVVSKDSRED
jgi:hypothetical protein